MCCDWGASAGTTTRRSLQDACQKEHCLRVAVLPWSSDATQKSRLITLLVIAASSNLSGGASGHNPHDVAAGKSLNSGAASVSAGQAGAPVPVVGMEFIAVPALDDFVTRVAETPDGALSEQDILELCSVIKAPELVKPLMELKQRQLRLVNKAKKQGSQ